jgi:hypothetical protein
VEGDIGWFRRNHLVPVPEVGSLAELNAMIDAWDEADEARRIGGRPRTIGEYFAVERPLLQPLPAKPFETGLLLGLRVDRHSRISVRTNRYSVPARLIGRKVRVMLHASELVVYEGQTEVARHERLLGKAQERLASAFHEGRGWAAGCGFDAATRLDVGDRGWRTVPIRCQTRAVWSVRRSAWSPGAVRGAGC